MIINVILITVIIGGFIQNKSEFVNRYGLFAVFILQIGIVIMLTKMLIAMTIMAKKIRLLEAKK